MKGLLPMRPVSVHVIAIITALLLAATSPLASAADAPIVIKLGTVAPAGSKWELDLKEMGQRWRDASGGRVKLQIYAGGVAGDEAELVRGMAIGKHQAAAITVVGLSNITPEPQALCVPQMLRSYEELDYVREHLTTKYEELFARKGYTILHWADAGWLRFFSKKPFSNPEGMRRMKIFVWTGEAGTVELWNDAGFIPVPLAATDISLSLQSGLVDVVPMTALAALSTQANLIATHAVDYKWAPLVGATIVRTEAWEKIPADIRPRLLEIAKETGAKLRAGVRHLDDDALESMRKKGMTIHSVSAADAAAWVKLAESAHPRIRTTVVTPDSFDAVRKLRDEYRALHAKDAALGPPGPASRVSPGGAAGASKP